jgi:serine/threonine protein kinase
MKLIGRLDVLWRLKSLHHIATGLNQLHANDIVHQDIKPSNVLIFGSGNSKLADVGRSACQGQTPPHHSAVFPGDWTYAPPDVLYRFPLPDHLLRALSFDAYLLGSMVVYFFTGSAITPLLLAELGPLYSDWQRYAGSTDDIKLHLDDAFARVLGVFAQHTPADLRSELVGVVTQLCEPDPSRRGHPAEHQGAATQFSLQRYRTKFDLLLKRAEATMFRR